MQRAAEVEHKLAAVRAWLEETGREAVAFTDPGGFAWITAGGQNHIEVATGVASVVVTREGAYLRTTNIEVQRLLDEELAGLPFTPRPHLWFGPPSDTVEEAPAALRFTLLEPELERYRALGVDAATAVEVACLAARPGDTEHDVAAAVARECARRGIQPLVDLVAADERIARYRHPLPTSRRIERTVLVALTGRRHGLHASLTRMVSFGPPDDELAARYAAVQRVDVTYQLASRPGRSLSEILGEGAGAYAAEGFPDEWQRHHQGGLTGYAGREIFATPTAAHRLSTGQATAWNPSITRVKSEDTTVVTASGVEVLTRTGAWPQVRVESSLGALDRPGLLER